MHFSKATFRKAGNYLHHGYALTEEGKNEFQQAVIRVIILSATLLYFVVSHIIAGDDSILTQSMVILVGLFVAASLANILSFRYIPGISHIRRTITLIVDLSVLSYGLHIGGSAATVCFSIYLWLIVGYGLRYGQTYLFAGTLIGTLEFLIVLNVTEYWVEQRTTGYGLLIGLVVLPIFFSVLLNKLTKAKALAEYASKSKSQFLANMSHEIRTPLNGVICLGNLLASTSLNKEQKELTNSLQSSAMILLSLIEDILDISKIEAGKFTIEQTDFDLHEMLIRLISMMKHQANSKGIDLLLKISPDTPYRLIGDSNHLRQVFINLVGNAIKFTDSGSVTLDVRPLKQDLGSTTIRFEVIDTGIGISSEAQTKIFDSFTQADISTTRKFGGTGLGTTISKQIIQIMGGEIGVNSEIGLGSTFWVELPMIRQDSDNRPDTYLIDNTTIFILGETLYNELYALTKSWGINSRLAKDINSLNNFLQDNSCKDNLTVILTDAETLGSDIEEFADVVASHNQGLHGTSAVIVNNTQSLNNETLYSHGYSSVIDYPVNPDSLFSALHMQSLQTSNVSDATNITESNDTSIQKLRILVAEDNTTNQLVIKKILERAGHIPHIVNNGQEALDEVDKNEYDLLILDMQMPVMGGIEATKIYNYTTEIAARKPVIILTANATTNAIKECESANIDAYLTKPIDIGKLTSTINKLTKNITAIKTESNETSANPYSGELIDITVLDSLRSLSNNESFIAILINGYIDDLASILKNMELSISTKDYGKFGELVHALKGSSGSIGASKLHKLCSIEDLAMSSDAEYISLMKEIVQVSAETSDALTQHIGHNNLSNNLI
ncbi:MAG: ATP-binding protein [Nitrosomonas sp.]|nr:ATP-binding protein [Nitrosomonas sp.]